MMRQLPTPQRTHPLIWVVAFIIAIIYIMVIFGSIVSVVGYMHVHTRRLPIIRVTNAHLDLLRYNKDIGVLDTKMKIVIQTENDNAKVYAFFEETEFKVSFGGRLISVFKAEEFEVDKEQPMSFDFLVPSSPIPLSHPLMQAVDYAVKQDVITFELIGGTKTRWRVGPLRLVKFTINLSCELKFRPSDHSYIRSPCTSTHKH